MTNLSGPSTGGLAAVLGTALDAVIVMRFDGTVAGWNWKAEQTFGWTSVEVEGRRMSELIIPSQYRELHEQGLSRFLESGDGPVLDRRMEITAVDRSGREMPVELSITVATDFGEPVFIGFVRDITERREAESRRQRMLRELSHRVKNLLSVVAAIAQQTARASGSIEEFHQAYQGRLQSLARAHDLLVAGQSETASFGALVQEFLHAAADERLQFGGPELRLSASQLFGLSMILHELFTNAVKYGALARPHGAVQLRWNVSADHDIAEVLWQETGVAGIVTPKSRGFGHEMIAMSVRHDLHGEFDSVWSPEGLSVTMRFPIVA